MNYQIDYLLKYISNETFNKIKVEKSDYILTNLEDNYRDVDLNIKYLLNYGINHNIDKVIYEMLEDLFLPHNDFINKINSLEKNLTKEEIIAMLENQ